GIPVAHATVAMGVLEGGAVVFHRQTGDDIDHAHQGVGPVGGRVGAAKDLDAIDVLDGQRQFTPVHGGQARPVNRAAIDQHLQAPRLGNVGAVQVDVHLVAPAIADMHARYQPENFRDIACAAGTDQFPV